MTRSAASEHDTAAFRELMNRETKGKRMNGPKNELSGGLKTEWVKVENRKKKEGRSFLPPLCNRLFPARPKPLASVLIVRLLSYGARNVLSYV